jgi:RNA polymerase sigma-70 factor (ECF subfamily)
MHLPRTAARAFAGDGLTADGAGCMVQAQRRGRVRDAEADYSWFYRGEYPHVVRTVFLILHDRQLAEDITQDAFVQLYAHWNKVSNYERPDAWVRRVAIRMAIRQLKRERMRSVLERETGSPSIQPTVDVDLLRAMRELPVTQQVVVVLFYFEDRPIAEIEHILGTSEGAVKMALSRARRRLAELLGEEVSEDVHRH